MKKVSLLRIENVKQIAVNEKHLFMVEISRIHENISCLCEFRPPMRWDLAMPVMLRSWYVAGAVCTCLPHMKVARPITFISYILKGPRPQVFVETTMILRCFEGKSLSFTEEQAKQSYLLRMLAGPSRRGRVEGVKGPGPGPEVARKHLNLTVAFL